MRKVIFILIICFMGITSAYSQPYRYPVLPGDSLWKATGSYTDRIKLCTIPESVLSEMSTEDLITTVFQFPYIQNLLLFDNFILGFDSLAVKFNGLGELENRNDSYQKLFQRYTDSTYRNNIAQNILFEYLIALDFNNQDYSNSQRLILLDSCLSKLGKRIESDNFLVEKSTISAAFLLIRLLAYIDTSNYNRIITSKSEVDDFKRTSQRPDKSTINKIIQEAMNYRSGGG